MKYLEKSFSVSMHIPRKRSIFDYVREPMKQPLSDEIHEFEYAGLGMCRHCALDQRGHDAKMARIGAKQS